MPYELEFNPWSEGALETAPPAEREKIRAAIERIRTEDFTKEPSLIPLKDLHGEHGPGGPFAFRASPLAWVVFSIERGNRLAIQDIINARFIQRYG
jgi:hypothetical protein